MSVEQKSMESEISTTHVNNEKPVCPLGHDIIGHICKYLDVEDLKSCRLVSPIWLYGSTPVLKVRTETTIQLSPGSEDDDLSNWDIISDVLDKLTFSPVNVSFTMGSLPHYQLPSSLNISEVPEIKNFKSINLQFPIGPRFSWQTELCTRFILSSSSTLKKLQFPDIQDKNNAPDFPPLGGTVFPKLKKLKMSEIFHPSTVSRVAKFIATSAPLECLTTECDYLVEILKSKEFNLPRSLKRLELYGKLDADGMKLLLKIPAGLTKLFVGDLNLVYLQLDDNPVDEVVTIFYKLLKKQAPTLEKLGVGMDQGVQEIAWKFPVFPTLKKLYVNYARIKTSFVFETGLESGQFGGICYAVSFPGLEFLDITIPYLTPGRAESFLPAEIGAEVVPSVRDVTVVVILEERDTLEQIKLWVKFYHLFPNAREDIMEEVTKLLGLA